MVAAVRWILSFIYFDGAERLSLAKFWPEPSYFDPNLLGDNSRFGEFNSRLARANSRFAVLRELAGKALICLTVFAAKRGLRGSNR
jgi:hypothetical protein